MEISFKARIILTILVNIVLFILLYNIPVNSKILENLCIYKNITGNECINCGMTRACLSILHFDFHTAYMLNKNIIIVFPFAICIYLYSWYKYITKQ